MLGEIKNQKILQWLKETMKLSDEQLQQEIEKVNTEIHLAEMHLFGLEVVKMLKATGKEVERLSEEITRLETQKNAWRNYPSPSEEDAVPKQEENKPEENGTAFTQVAGK